MLLNHKQKNLKKKTKMLSSVKLTNAEYQKQRREKHKKLGLCISCNNKAAVGSVRCAYHIEKHNISDKRYKALRKKQGLCSECGAVSAIGYSRCDAHIVKANNGQKKYITKKRKEWKLDNKCTRCGSLLNPEMDGGCVKCLNCRIETHLPFKKTDFKF